MPTMYVNGPGIDNPLSMKLAGSSTWSYPLTDHLGTGGVTDSFGNGGATFTGREYDSYTQLYYYRARMYDPKLGRFTSEDPIRFRGGDINLYGYVWNNPLNHTDPMGLDGFGNDWADYFDSKIEFARQFWKPQEEGDPDWITNGVNNSVADVAHGTVDMLRCGSGIGQAFSGDENGYGIAAFVAMDVSRCSGLFATLASPFAPRASGRIIPDDPKPYCNSRPGYGRGQIDDVWDGAKDADGRVFDPFTGEELLWDKARPRNGQWDMGHKDMPYRTYHRQYMNGEITLDQFKRIHRDSTNYRPESVRSNRSRNGRN